MWEYPRVASNCADHVGTYFWDVVVPSHRLVISQKSLEKKNLSKYFCTDISINVYSHLSTGGRLLDLEYTHRPPIIDLSVCALGVYVRHFSKPIFFDLSLFCSLYSSARGFFFRCSKLLNLMSWFCIAWTWLCWHQFDLLHVVLFHLSLCLHFVSAGFHLFSTATVSNCILWCVYLHWPVAV